MDGEIEENGAYKRAFSPVGAGERVAVLDALRGIAILGILAAFRIPAGLGAAGGGGAFASVERPPRAPDLARAVYT